MDRTNDELLLDDGLSIPDLEALSASRRGSLVLDSPRVAAKLLASDIDDQADASIVINHVSQIMAIALQEHDGDLFNAGIKSLVEIWKQGKYEALYPVRPPEFEASLWERLGISLYALGGLAVAGQRWAEVRELTRQSPTGGSGEKSWLRQGQVVSARGNDYYPEESMLQLADRRLRGMRPGVAEAASRQFLTRFDLLSGLIISEENLRGFYPNAAEFSEELIEPLVIDELRKTESAVRQYVFPDDNAGLIRGLAEYDRVARLQAALARHRNQRWEWRGFSDARTLVFLAEGNILEDWT